MFNQNLKMILLSVMILCWIGNTEESENNSRIVRRMIGGKRVEIEDFPYMIAIFYQRNQGRFSGDFLATFTLITTRTALGAAHVITNFAVEGLYGTVGHKDKYFGRKVYFAKKVQHPNFVEDLFHYDVALLIIKDVVSKVAPSVLPSFVHPIALPHKNRDYHLSKALIIGWGRTGTGIHDTTRYLHAADVNIINVNDTSFKNNPKYESKSLILTRERGVSIMTGDSGGPLISRENGNTPVLIGVTSASEKKPGGVNFHVSTIYFIDFITHNSVGDLTFV
ncbi:CLIP domain-containing serine protease B4-like [Centruroides vittatus]|uniref:CLIP domain-containing serine protease B4-like n=1 Tax=Centruroides vittatus TaxID=120091 RepID=UPI0035106092